MSSIDPDFEEFDTRRVDWNSLLLIPILKFISNKSSFLLLSNLPFFCLCEFFFVFVKEITGFKRISISADFGTRFCYLRFWDALSGLHGTSSQYKEYLQNDQQAIRDSSVIFVAPYWRYRISCLKVQLAPLAQGADSEKWNIGLDLCKKRRRMERIFEFV